LVARIAAHSRYELRYEVVTSRELHVDVCPCRAHLIPQPHEPVVREHDPHRDDREDQNEDGHSRLPNRQCLLLNALLFPQHFAEQLTRIEAQCTRQFGELDDVDAALAAFDLRDVRMRALQSLRQASLRQSGLHSRLRKNGTQHTMFATAQCLHGALRFRERMYKRTCSCSHYRSMRTLRPLLPEWK